jgi:hypothetical protein
MTAVAGLDEVHLELAAEGADDHVAHLGGGARRHRIDHHQRAHGHQLTRGIGPDTPARLSRARAA